METFFQPINHVPNTPIPTQNDSTPVQNASTPVQNSPTHVPNTPTPVPNNEPNDTNPVELKSPKKEKDGDDDQPMAKKKHRHSDVWAHFNRVKGGNPNEPRCKSDKKQKLLSFKRGIDGEGSLLAATFNKVRCRNAMAKFVVKDEQAFNVASHGGIKSDIYLDETNTYQFLEHEEDNMGKVKDSATSNENTKTRGKTINVTVIDD
ncbi:hypothetical protein POM88_049452 [Heracleum sosnowskyi]|uniref:Uncharacterized protein n=1 Tax=Heracleum sosnowskyi TaxID=360622 RepID=A0AAD8GWW1_9APIA|nr:hypothetical protein POM88_049452 [Heracleum sosnowskyi]